jgi:diketogulonate reductase-like aldo/keto reductase
LIIVLRECLVLSELKENYLESVMISLPNYGAQLTLAQFMPLWRVVEDYIDKQKLLSAGVCDFMLPLLSGLCDAAKVITVDVRWDAFHLSLHLITESLC